MNTISNERLEAIAKNALSEERRMMAAELLVLRKEREKAEPVAYIFKHPVGKLFWALTDESNKDHADVMPVDAAPPAPSHENVHYADAAEAEIAALCKRIAELEASPPAPVVADAATAIRACLDEFPESVHDIVEECAVIAENACRAAMIQSAMQPRDKCGLTGIHACMGSTETDTTSKQFESLAGKAVGEDASSMADAHMAWLNTNFPRNAYSDEEWEEVSLYTWLAWRDSQRNACFPGT
ncbi:hypothetical protein QMT30_19165 [Cronobacter sakazakii]|nr:hypothetical protein [Cronobacter sakazakii]MDK1241821.1 hypothetical protein [Cronobacter sakazakii]